MSSFQFSLQLIYMYHVFFIPSSIRVFLGWSHLLAANNAAISMDVQISLRYVDGRSFHCRCTSGIAVMCYLSAFRFFEIWLFSSWLPQGLHKLTFPPAVNQSSPSPISLLALSFVLLTYWMNCLGNSDNENLCVSSKRYRFSFSSLPSRIF